jgi:hypothetical protein
MAMSSIIDCHHIWPEAYRYFQAALQALHFIAALTPLLASCVQDMETFML